MSDAGEDVVLPEDLQDGHSTRSSVRLHYKLAGEGHPEMLLHGMLERASHWPHLDEWQTINDRLLQFLQGA